MKCEICKKDFSKKQNPEESLALHMKMKHTEIPVDTEKQAKTETKTQTPTALTPEERAIADLVAADSEEWGPIREDELNDFSLMKNPLDLPPEAVKLQKREKFAFRWCECKPERIRELTKGMQRPMRWRVVNKTTLPELGYLVDSMTGGIQVLDQILLCKPWYDHMVVQKAKQELARSQDASGTIEGKSVELSGDGIHASAGIRKLGDESPTPYEVSGSDEVMAEAG